jgi:hypothetical protein
VTWDEKRDAIAFILLKACEGPKAQLRPWRPFDIDQVARAILDGINEPMETPMERAEKGFSSGGGQ